MNFTDFQEYRRTLLGAHPQLLDCAETNLYRALAHLRPTSPAPAQEKIHRCHLASQWTTLFDLPPEVSKRAFISSGIRDSLARLFAHYAGKRARLWLPQDNYPVYHELATAAGLAPRSFATLLDIQWPDEPPPDQDEVMLITHPLKPRNRPLDAADVGHLKSWLARSPQRRVWLDAVYTLDTRFDEVTQDLLATGQTVLLHSLTKGWLHPRLFGITLVPEHDAAELTPLFRQAPPTQENLATARYLMADHEGMPGKVAEELKAARERLFTRLPDLLHQGLPTPASGYFFPIRSSWEELLQHGVLGLPATVFGSSRDDLTLFSSLSFIP